MTPTQLIAAVRAWSAHVITQPNDRMRLYVDAVLAVADATFALDDLAASHKRFRNGDINERQYQRILTRAEETTATAQTALLAAGVEVENG